MREIEGDLKLPKIAVIYSEEYLQHKTNSHPESPARVKIAYQRIISSKIYLENKVDIVLPIKASKQYVLKVHSEELIKSIKKLSESGGGMIAPDTIVSSKSYEVALLAVGGAIKALNLILSNEYNKAFALIRPPGHHASYNRAKGFCLFNNIAITVKEALDRGLKRIMILDWDAHHGDGTQSIFYDNPNVLYISTHQDGRTLYPGTGFIDEIGEGEGEGYNVNIPLPPKTNGPMVIRAVNEIVIPIAEQFKPEIIMVSAGYDAHYADLISDLNFTTITYYKLASIVRELAEKYCNGRVLIVLEGGYHLKYMPISIVNTLCGLLNEEEEHRENEFITSPSIERYIELLIKRIKKILSKYWSF